MEPTKEYLDSCEQNKPLAVIPTKIPEVSQKELQKHFKIIIYANQLLRASIIAAEDITKKIRQEGLSAQSESTIASLKNVFSYNDMDGMTELEKHFYKPVN